MKKRTITIKKQNEEEKTEEQEEEEEEKTDMGRGKKRTIMKEKTTPPFPIPWV
jgi:protein subunit release factor B